MIYIVLSVLVNALLFIIFKLFDKYKVDTFQAIVFNYLFAFLVAYSQSNVTYSLLEIPKQKWFFGAVILGFLFIIIFNVMAKTVQKMGISVVAVASKMSVVIPILFGILIYKEAIGLYKIIGIILALIAVYFSSVKKGEVFNIKLLYLPIVLFLGSGTLDTLLKYIEKNFVQANETAIYTGTIFLVAVLLGFIVMIYLVISKKLKLSFKNLIAGVILGIPNYFSIYFLLKALQTKGLDSSTIFTVNNVGIVLLSSIIGLLLFKEKLSKMNYFGIILSVIAILLITLFI
ncbi:MAG: EamA family transporter [Flavobacteriaceae bacterium]|nr:EamA family transporter [Flavobacteriaceae bacterium]